MNFQPLGPRLLIQRANTEQTTASGIILPGTSQRKNPAAKVIAIGKEVQDVQVGETVMISDLAGTELKLDGQDYLLIHQNDILGVLE